MTDLDKAIAMDPERVTDRDGCWYLRRLVTDDVAAYLVSARAPAGTASGDLTPDVVEIHGPDTDEPITLNVEQLQRFLQWPPTRDVG